MIIMSAQLSHGGSSDQDQTPYQETEFVGCTAGCAVSRDVVLQLEALGSSICVGTDLPY